MPAPTKEKKHNTIRTIRVYGQYIVLYCNTSSLLKIFSGAFVGSNIKK